MIKIEREREPQTSDSASGLGHITTQTVEDIDRKQTKEEDNEETVKYWLNDREETEEYTEEGTEEKTEEDSDRQRRNRYRNVIFGPRRSVLEEPSKLLNCLQTQTLNAFT